MAVKTPNAYGVFSAPGIPSTLIPNNPVTMVRTTPTPPNTAKLWVTRRLLSWIDIQQQMQDNCQVNLGEQYKSVLATVWK